MINIEKCSEYNVRVIKSPDFDNNTEGYNFSYPEMNSIDVCNLLISGRSVDITMNGSAKSTWSFDKENKILKISRKNGEETHIIDNPKELGTAIMDYFDKNKAEIMQKTYDTNMKKSQAKEGNQNAKICIYNFNELETALGWIRQHPMRDAEYMWSVKEKYARLQEDVWRILFHALNYKTFRNDNISE